MIQMNDAIRAAKERHADQIRERREKLAAAQERAATEGPKPRKIIPMVVLPAPYPFPLTRRALYSVLLRPKRVSRFLRWAVDLPWRGMELLRVLTSGQVDGDTYHDRMLACYGCPARVVKVSKRLTRTQYCHQCGCPKWKLAELRFKNKLKGWECPRELHAGPYRKERYEGVYQDITGEKLVTGLPIAPQQHAPAGKGCGG